MTNLQILSWPDSVILRISDLNRITIRTLLNVVFSPTIIRGFFERIYNGTDLIVEITAGANIFQESGGVEVVQLR